MIPIVFVASMVWFMITEYLKNPKDDPPMFIMGILVAVLLGVIIGIVLSLVQRFKEIKGEKKMLLLNIDYIPKKEIEVLGLVKGNVVQSKNFGRDFMAGMKTIVGGEIESYTEMLNQARQIAVKRMVDEAEQLVRTQS